MYDIIFSPKAIRQLKSLERQVRDVLKLEYADNRFRLRVGDWRVTFRYRFENQEVHIAEVVHRSKAYRR